MDITVVQKNLIQIGYLPTGADDGKWGGGSKRALLRFTRRASTSTYRVQALTKAAADCNGAECFTGKISEIADDAIVTEIEKWIAKKWVAPLGRFAFKK